MIMRKAEPSDRRQIINLWVKVFGDSEDVAARLLDDFAGEGNVYVAEESGKVVAQLLAVPCEAGSEKGAYLYGLATDPEYRSKGIMGQMMKYAEAQIAERGDTFFVLIPASRSLFDYYDAHGFKNMFLKTANLDLTSDRELSNMGKNTPDNINNDEADGSCNIKHRQIPTDLFIRLRNRYLDSDLVTFSDDRVNFELEEQWYYECKVGYCHQGYIFYLKVDDTLYITEVAVETQRIAKQLIYSACHHTGCRQVKVTLPEESTLFSSLDDVGKWSVPERTLQAQYKWWGPGSPPDFYLRFALDDLPARIISNKADIIL